jgi:hypothetical protein
VQANFRLWRDFGLTWLAMSGPGVDEIMRRAGHDNVKQAEDLGDELGEPFAPLTSDLTGATDETTDR